MPNIDKRLGQVSEETVAAIRRMVDERERLDEERKKLTSKAIAEQVGVPEHTVCKIAAYQSYRWVTQL